jgi:2-dehydro-3-deoxyphosphogluconate aldolase / (4S)-4-hydroxy-2-oxoglutarate aldolase
LTAHNAKRCALIRQYARPRVIRGTRAKPLPLLPSGPGGVCSDPLHEARSLTTFYATSLQCHNRRDMPNSIPKLTVLNSIVDSGLVAIVRVDSSEHAIRIAEACAEGGVAALEVTFTVPDAASVIENLMKRYAVDQIAIGAGTVLDPETARVALLAGARFLVSPSLSLETARLANRYQVPYMPGVATAREVVEAMECGCDILKVFPGETLGPTFLRAVKAPLPQAALMPTGGVSIDNVGEWISAGAIAVGVGGNLIAGAKTGDYASITNLAKRFLEAIKAARA